MSDVEKNELILAWKEATIAWSVCASIHRNYAHKRDALYSTRQGDFIRHAEFCRKKLVALLDEQGQHDA